MHSILKSTKAVVSLIILLVNLFIMDSKKHWCSFLTTGKSVIFGPHEMELMLRIFKVGLKDVVNHAKVKDRFEMVIRWRKIGGK